METSWAALFGIVLCRLWLYWRKWSYIHLTEQTVSLTGCCHQYRWGSWDSIHMFDFSQFYWLHFYEDLKIINFCFRWYFCLFFCYHQCCTHIECDQIVPTKQVSLYSICTGGMNQAAEMMHLCSLCIHVLNNKFVLGLWCFSGDSQMLDFWGLTTTNQS